MNNVSEGKEMKYSAILLLAGRSTRFNGEINKVYMTINQKKLFQYSLDVFNKDEKCEKIIVVYNEQDHKLLFENNDSFEKLAFTVGGSERYLSVLNGLKLVNTEYVLVHDGARPLISQSIVDDVLDSLKDNDCVSVGVPITDTIKKVNNDGTINTICRDKLYSVQTPQGCKTELLKNALKKVTETDNITDDLMAIEKYTDILPKIILGSKKNIKVTTLEDLKIVQMFLELGE